ncbi:hypothetical protein [Pseudomonas chlororaphis]|uniref:hypothetical protein n=1 Tax=Pseudomonas chlororaphis TaxID=587753 RepID=UPI0014763EA1|nr:hypothetical protein [Pseudomonas chlororaphis]NNB45255.1 hypothetical protein [Pseudomonas chlororaphis]
MKFYWLFLFLLLGACDSKDIGSSSMVGQHTVIKVQLHEDVENVVSGSSLKFEKECMSQVNMCWYKISKSFSDDNLPSVMVNGSLKLDQVASASIAVDQDVGSNVESLDLSIRSLPDGSRHEEYQAFLYKLLKEIKSTGWVHYYSPSDPRISGAESDKIQSPNKVLGDYVLSHPWLDPDYEIDLERWLKIGKFYNWHFYKDGDHLTLKAWRRDSDDAPDERGTYLVSLSFTTEREYFVSGFSETEDKKRWKELLPRRLEEYKKIRGVREKKAVDAGIKIDTGYQDPPIQALRN